jgi:hypothetical protein
MPTNVTDLLDKLGVKIEVPAPVVTKNGASATVDAEAVRITLDTKPLRAVLPTLPLDPVVNNLPDLGQANVLKGLLLSLNTIAPRLVLHLGQSSAAATTVPNFDFGGAAAGGPATSGTAGTPASAAAGAPAATSAAPAETAPASTAPATTTAAVSPASAVPGLPPLGSIPAMLAMLGLLLASGAGWYLRRAGGLLFGAGATCSHGLKAGIPDLRKA